MTRSMNARLAGCTFLFYIVAGITSLALGDGAPAREVLSVFTSLSALVLGVTLYAITRVEDADLALLGLTCRVLEAIPGGEGASGQWNAIFFALGSTLFAWLLLRGRMIPGPLAWLGLIASVVLAALLLLQRAGMFGGAGSWSSSATWFQWLPMLVFEVALALWLIVRGVATPAQKPSS